MERMEHANPPAGIRGGAPVLDWSVGCYESSAEHAQLLPAAKVVIDRAGLGPHDRVLDVGCGTGNAALLAAGRAAQVSGVDPATRLLDVARGRAAAEGKDVTFLPGHAGALPVGDSSVDVIVSVFAVIFAPDPAAAAAEMSRVLSPTGRIVLSAWLPAGTMFELNSAANSAICHALGAPEPTPFAWHDGDALASLFAPHGLEVQTERHELGFTAPSAKEFFDVQAKTHPLAVAGLGVLGQFGQAETVRGRLLAILEEGNEEHDGFRITVPYVVVTGHRMTEPV